MAADQTTLGNFDTSTQDAAACGFVQPVSGDGFALTCHRETQRFRFDVWADNFHQSVPMLGWDQAVARAATQRLLSEAEAKGNADAVTAASAFRSAMGHHG